MLDILKGSFLVVLFSLYERQSKKKYLDRAFLTRRGNSPAQNPGTLVYLLDNIISVNSPVLCPMNENGEPEKSVKAEYLKEFLSMPMKDLINEVKVNELNLNKKSSKPDMQIDKTSISSESPSFPVEPQLSIGSRATHVLLQNDTERQAIIKKLDKIKTEKIETREFLIKRSV